MTLKQFLVNEVNKNNAQAQGCLAKISNNPLNHMEWYGEWLYKSHFLNSLLSEASDNILLGKSDEQVINEAITKAKRFLTRGKPYVASQNLMAMAISMWQTDCYQTFFNLMTCARDFIKIKDI